MSSFSIEHEDLLVRDIENDDLSLYGLEEDETCHQCGGVVKIIASIKDLVVITKILHHLNRKNDEIIKIVPPESRAPLQASLFE